MAWSVAWRRGGAAAVAVGMLAVATAGAASAAPQFGQGPTLRVIVSGPLADLHGLVSSHGGKVKGDVGLVNGVVADVSLGQLMSLEADPLVTVSMDSPVMVADTPLPATGRAPAAVFSQTTGAAQLTASGITGSGVNVAVVDTGITPLPDFGSRLVAGVDLSGEGNPFADNYGHGTFVAGLIAGNGASSAGQYVGEAPGAGLVSVKVAGASGATDMATVINGINWVVQNADKYNIRVVNLSLGAIPTQSTSQNPLDKAVEAAWKHNIVVVASAGNAGPFNGTILSPGDDPLVITVGASDDQGTAAMTDDNVTSFSSVGPTSPDGWYKPDLVAPGRSVVSLRAPGSTIDIQNPTAVIGTSNFVGSGTSFSAAISSGAAALILQANPKYNSQQVKAAVLGTAVPAPAGNPFVDGHGQLNVYAAATTTGLNLKMPPSQPPATMGSTVSLAKTWKGSSWDATAWNVPGSLTGLLGAVVFVPLANTVSTLTAGASWNGLAWDGSAWNGSAWNGSAWNGSAWNGVAWNGSAWNGSAWNGSAWNGSAWNGSAWNGAAWNGSAWNGSAWNGSAWNGSAWNGSAWN